MFGKTPKGYEPLSSLAVQSIMQKAAVVLPSAQNDHIRAAIDSLPATDMRMCVLELSTTQDWLRHGVCVFPSPGLCQELLETDALEHVCGLDIKVTLPSLLITMPNGFEFVSPYDGTRIRHLFVRFYDTGETAYATMSGKVIEFIPPQERFVNVSAMWPPMECQSACMPLCETRPLSDTLDAFCDHYVVTEHEKTATDESIAASKVVGRKTMNFVMNLALMMQAFPEYVLRCPPTFGRTRTQAEFRRHGAATYMVARPTTRGVTQVVFEGRRPTNVETHARATPPGQHWRRGHWRRQQHGDAWAAEGNNRNAEQTRTIDGQVVRYHMVHVAPVLVMAEQETAS